MPKPTKKLEITDIPLPADMEPDETAPVVEPSEEDFEQPKTTALPIASLNFLDDEGVLITLKHPFKDGFGNICKEIRCRPLSFGQVQDFTRRAVDEDGIELAELYAAIAGIDLPTLRGLKAEDGEAITDAAQDFLPRAFRGDQKSG